MYVERHAYYCEHGFDSDRCLSAPVRESGAGWELARAQFGNNRSAALAARSAVLATSAVIRCTEGLAEDDAGRRVPLELPLFVASGTGLGFAAHFAHTLSEARSDVSLEEALFAGGGPLVTEVLRYSAMMLAGMVAKFGGIRGENRSLTGANAGLLALRQAERYLRQGRATRALVVCGESLAEWGGHVLRPQQPAPREFGCAFLVTQSPHSARAKVYFDCVPRSDCRPAPFEHFEAVSAPASLCWALEQDTPSEAFAETDIYGQNWSYGIERI